MAVPRFRFVETCLPDADAQFWRDVEASERLGSRFKANLYLRELCHTKAWRGGSEAGMGDHFASEHRERALLQEVAARGYRLFGADIAARDDAAASGAGFARTG